MSGKCSKAARLFGAGPAALFSGCVIMAGCAWADRCLGRVPLGIEPAYLRIASVILAGLGLALHAWSILTLRKWWEASALCVTGPYKWFRHPMYASWATFILPGAALWLDSWICLAGIVLIHAAWHFIVMPEERMMLDLFGDEYRRYAARTGRFVPRLWRRIAV